MSPSYYRSNPRQVARSTEKSLQIFVNRVWSKVNWVRLREGDKEADELESALRFLDSLREECRLLAF